METSRIRDGVRAGLPLALAPLLFGASFGLLAVDAGMGWVGAVAMSATTFAGSAQFAAASILEDGGGALAAIVAAILLNARYVPLSLAVASIFPGSRRRRFLESQLIVDESWALSGRSGRFDYAILAGVGILLYVLWVGGTAIGTVVGDLLDPEAIGLDAAFPALFLALLAPYLRTRRALVTALVAGAITLVLLPFAPPGVPIVAASFAALIGLRTVTWVVIVVVGVVTMAFKASGPVLLGRRELPPRVTSVVEVLAPAMLAALVVTQTVGGDRAIVIDERLAGVVAGGVAIWLRAPIIVVMLVAATTDAVRLSDFATSF